jgi:hypothetical protein
MIFTGLVFLMLINMTVLYAYELRYKATFVVVLVAFMIHVCMLPFYQVISYWSVLLVSLTILSLDFSVLVFQQCTLVATKIKNLVLTMTFFFFVFAYIGTYHYAKVRL